MYFFPKQEARRKRIRDVCKDKFATDPAWREAYREAAQQREEEIFVERTKYGNAVEGKHISHMCLFFSPFCSPFFAMESRNILW